MKKLFFILLMLIPGVMFAAPAPKLSFKFANPGIINKINLDGATYSDYFYFDVLVKQDASTSFMWTSQIKLLFNNSAFDNTEFKVNKLGNFIGDNNNSVSKYSITKTITDISSGKIFNIGLTGDNGILALKPVAANLTQITTTFQPMVRIFAKLLPGTSSMQAGINFYPDGMDGQAEFLPGVVNPVATLYLPPNLYDARNFLTAYTGRIYSVLNDWSQVGGTEADTPYIDWSTPVGTTVWDGDPILDAATIAPALIANATALQIQSPAVPPYTTLTIAVDGQVTVTGSPGITEISTGSSLIIQSDATGTGSLITNSVSGSGTTSAQAYLTTGRWHLVSSPVGETVLNFLTFNTSAKIPLKSGKRGMMDYNTGTNAWNDFFTDGGSTYGSIGSAKGFCLRSAANDFVTATGALQAGTVMPSVIANAWNCVGNPYSSAMGINSSAGTFENFLTVNQASLSALYGAVYIWDNADANNVTGSYTAISNVPSPTGTPTIQQGQGFLVRVASPTYLTFTETMQLHAPALALKSATKLWPTIKLNANVNNLNSSTIIAFNSGMTKGLDPTYDAGLFKGESDLAVYTKLVEGNEDTPFTIQALPDNKYSGMIIPVGIDSKIGGDVVFSADLFNLPAEAKVILEDKLKSTFTDLSTSSYKATIGANSVIADRFRLHNSTSTVSALGGQNPFSKLNAYAYRNVEIRIEGEVTSETVATLYDVTGKAVLIQKLLEGSLNVIPVSSVSSGLYLLVVKEGSNAQTFKILLKD